MTGKGKGAKDKVFLFYFTAPGNPTWYYHIASPDDRGVYDPRFASIDSAWQGTWPDPGVSPGTAPNTMFGERLGQDMLDRLPKTIAVGGFTDKSLGKHPRDINILTDGEFNVHRLVSQRLKDVIEDLEQGVHQFAPVSFVNYVTREPIWTDRPWYILNITKWIAPDLLFDVESMGDYIGEKINPPYNSSPSIKVTLFPSWMRYKRYVAKRSVAVSEIGSKHLWVTSRYFKAADHFVLVAPAAFCSETFRRACKAAGLKGGHFVDLTKNWHNHGR